MKGETIQGRKLKGGNYSREETICGNTVTESQTQPWIQLILHNRSHADYYEREKSLAVSSHSYLSYISA